MGEMGVSSSANAGGADDVFIDVFEAVCGAADDADVAPAAVVDVVVVVVVVGFVGLLELPRLSDSKEGGSSSDMAASTGSEDAGKDGRSDGWRVGLG